jgi:hypothetical protein
MIQRRQVGRLFNESHTFREATHQRVGIAEVHGVTAAKGESLGEPKGGTLPVDGP